LSKRFGLQLKICPFIPAKYLSFLMQRRASKPGGVDMRRLALICMTGLLLVMMGCATKKDSMKAQSTLIYSEPGDQYLEISLKQNPYKVIQDESLR